MDSGTVTHRANVRVPPFLRSAWISGPRSQPGSGAKSSTVMVDTILPGGIHELRTLGVMTTVRHPEPSARRALWVGGMLAILAGLFGMHGLDSHGTAGMGSMTEAAMPGSVMRVGRAADTKATTVPDVGSAVASVPVVTGHPLMDMGMAGMCLAVLALALVALLRFLRTNRVRPVLWVLARPARAPVRVGRRPDAPSLIRLSIQRC